MTGRKGWAFSDEVPATDRKGFGCSVEYPATDPKSPAEVYLPSQIRMATGGLGQVSTVEFVARI